MAHHKPMKSLELVLDNFGHIHSNGAYLPVKRFTWKNQNRVQVQAINYGATITSIKCPNRKGIIDDIIIGYDDMKGYQEHQEYYYGIIGRFSNLVKHGNFILNKKEYKLNKNMGGHHYNGGELGFDKALWEYHVAGYKVILSHFSPDGQEGYPGNFTIFVTYELTSSNEFKVDIKAYSTKLTICNISTSTFFNLAGHSTGSDELYKHDVIINADCFTVTNNESLPTGEIRSVYNTMYDFQIPVKLGQVIDKFDGFNTNFCINKGMEQGNCFAARLCHAESGRILEIYTNQYGIQMETANNFPHKFETEKTSKIRCPYLKNAPSTFDLIDEIYNRILDISSVDKSSKYNDLIKFVRDLQKKDNTCVRSSSNASMGSFKGSMIKRSKITLDTISNITLTAFQVKYIEKILEKINCIPEPIYLTELKETLEKAYFRSKNRDDVQIRFSHSSSSDTRPDECSKDVRGKKGAKYCKHCGLCLQTQNYPDSCNNQNFPSCLLKPGGVYHHTIVYKFFVKTNNIGVTGYI